MNKKTLFLVLSLLSLAGFVAVLLLTVTDWLAVNLLYSAAFLVPFAVFILLYIREKSSVDSEQDFISAELGRQTEKPKHIRDFEIVRDCCEGIVAYLKTDRNIIAIGMSNNTYEYDGYYDFKEDRFEFLDCLYFFTYEMIEEVPKDFLSVLEDGFLSRKFCHVDATYSEDNIFMFKRDDETFYETFYVYATAPDALANSDIEFEAIGGNWYYVTSDKKFSEWFSV
ncbi:MAG: hypothetical protein IIU80_00130 [Clostridia bacterium]|nr:hypothetical protein [Clostridia bacterium]